MSQASTFGGLLRVWTSRLAEVGCDSARLDAEVLVGDALGVNRAWLVAHADDVPEPAALVAIGELLERRLAGEPVAYVTGRREFWSLSFEVDRTTLVPRADTELLVETALASLPSDRPCRVADLGTGSGIIAIAIARERPLASVVATDSSAAALAVAARNVERLAAGRVTLLHGDWWAPLSAQRFDLVLSNPPYIADGDAHLARGDLRYEPRSALVSAAHGLADIQTIIAGARAHLAAHGALLLEHGCEQADAVCDRLRRAGFEAVHTHLDLASRPRVSGGRRSS